MEKVKAFADETWSLTTGGIPPLPSNAVGLASPAMSVSPAAASLDPGVVLDELVADVDGVRAAILASVDGFGIARSTSIADEASHPAMLAATVGLAHQLVAIDGGERFRQLAVHHDGGLLLIWPIGAQRLLAVLAAGTVEQRRLRSFIQARAMVLSGSSA